MAEIHVASNDNNAPVKFSGHLIITTGTGDTTAECFMVTTGMLLEALKEYIAKHEL